MRATVTTIVAAACLVPWGTCIANAAAPRKELVLVGKVTSLKLGGGDEFKRWIVTVKVEKVVSGDFSGPTFQFAVHSPTRSGLEKGRSYTVEAIWDGAGYTVDELQWGDLPSAVLRRERAAPAGYRARSVCDTPRVRFGSVCASHPRGSYAQRRRQGVLASRRLVASVIRPLYLSLGQTW